MSTMMRATVTRITAAGVYVEIPALGNGVEYGPMPPPLAIGESADFLAVVSSSTIDLALTGTSLPKTLTAAVKPDTIPINDLSDVTTTAPAIGHVLRWNGSAWVNTTLSVDDLGDAAISGVAQYDVLQYNGSQWVNKTNIDFGGSGSSAKFTAKRALAGDYTLSTRYGTDTNNRLAIQGDGTLAWGDGTASSDTVLYRAAADTLQTDDAFRSNRTNTTDGAFAAKISTDTQNRLLITADGKMQWGPGGASAVDIALSRGTFAGDTGLIITKPLIMQTGAAGSNILQGSATGDTQMRFWLQNDGGMGWGPGGSTATDTALFRDSAGKLRTWTSFQADGALIGGGDLYLDSTSQGRGVKLAVSAGMNISSVSASTAAGSETAQYTSWSNNSMTWVDGRIYKITVTYGISDNIGSSYSVTIPRLYRAGGGGLGGWSHTHVANGHLQMDFTQVCFAKRNAGAGNLTAGVGATVQRYVSGVAGTSVLVSMTVVVEDIGLISDHAALAAVCAAVT